MRMKQGWGYCLSLTILLLFIFQIASDSVASELNRYGVQSDNPYVVRRFVQEGKEIDEVIVPGRPPEFYRAPEAIIPDVNAAAGIIALSNVPAFDWSYGCSATSAAMMFGYYDNTGYPNLYAGPANGGVCPMTNAVWGPGECPLSATHLGIDGRLIKGHVDDYWIAYGSTAQDPYITGPWPQHIQGECTGDFMGTNQSSKSNSDGSTTFWNYTDGSPLYDYAGAEPGGRDGCHGMKLFFESRGYAVTTNYSQYIYGYNGNTKGFTFAQYKQEIDAGRPVLIQVAGHTMLGYGYDDSGSAVYLRDTWDYLSHSMIWGGSYSGMQHYGVTVFQPSPAPSDLILSVSPTNRDVSKDEGVTTFEVSNTGTGTMPWTAEVTSGNSWLSISSGSSGTDAGTITCAFLANTTLTARTGIIRVTAADATGSPVDVTVVQAENTAPALTGLTISGPASVNENSTAIYAATASWSDGSTSAVTPLWGENSSYASINAAGVLTTISVTSNQTVIITASYTSGGITKTATQSVTIVNATLTGLSISGPASVNENSKTAYTATASWSNGSTSAVTPTWSENSSYASISTAGVLTTISVTSNKTLTITAKYISGGITKTATQSVTILNLVTLTGLSISGPASVSENGTAAYTATASWSNGSKSTVTATWSENSSYASISAAGVLTTISVSSNKTVAVTAKYTSGGITKSASKSVTIVNTTLTGLSISGPASVNENSTTAYTATASWSNGSKTTVAPTWSENSSYASISAAGVLTTISISSNKTLTITAKYTSGSITKSVTKSVTILNL